MIVFEESWGTIHIREDTEVILLAMGEEFIVCAVVVTYV